MEDVRWLSDTVLMEMIGKKIREWRVEANITQGDLAKRAEMALITYQHIEHGQGGSFHNYLRVLRVLDRLEALGPFLEEKQISPIVFQEMEKKMKLRQRASKKKEYDTDNDGTPVW